MGDWHSCASRSRTSSSSCGTCPLACSAAINNQGSLRTCSSSRPYSVGAARGWKSSVSSALVRCPGAPALCSSKAQLPVCSAWALPAKAAFNGPLRGLACALAAASLAGGVGCCASQLAGTRSVAVKLRAPCSVCTTPWRTSQVSKAGIPGAASCPSSCASKGVGQGWATCTRCGHSGEVSCCTSCCTRWRSGAGTGPVGQTGSAGMCPGRDGV